MSTYVCADSFDVVNFVFLWGANPALSMWNRFGGAHTRMQVFQNPNSDMNVAKKSSNGSTQGG